MATLTLTNGFSPPPALLAAAGTWMSSVVPVVGASAIGVSVTSSATGVLSLQRYYDALGQIPNGPPLTARLSPNIPAQINGSDAAVYESVAIQITNPGANSATLSSFSLVVSLG